VISTVPFKHRPDKEGIKTPADTFMHPPECSNTDLIKKGLRRFGAPRLDGATGSNTDLIKKGLRPPTYRIFTGRCSFKHRPDKEGIKTSWKLRCSALASVQTQT